MNGHKYILVAIDYFTKWVETASYSVLKAKHVARFIESNIVCQYGVNERGGEKVWVKGKERERI